MPIQTSKKCTRHLKIDSRKWGLHQNPPCGVLISRFYPRTILQKVFADIPRDATFYYNRGQFVHYRALKLFKMARLLQNSPEHKEAEGLVELSSKNLR
jgi:hypothetical protein